MSLTQWCDDLKVGVAAIDADHRALVELLNRIETACDGNDGGVVAPALRELERFTREHFAREERLMDEIGYPDRIAHAAEHHGLYWEIKHQLDDLVCGERALGEVVSFMRRWLLLHIVETDRELGRAIRERAAAVNS